MMNEREDSEDDKFFFSRAPRMPEDDIIMSEVAILTGGRDQHGRPIIAFPAKYHTVLESKVKASGMDSLLRYFIDITRVADRKQGFAFVTDLRFSLVDFILLLKSILNSIQAEMTGAVGVCVLYVILPLNKKTHKDALTHLALRRSKKKVNKTIIPPYFQSVAVDDEVELYNYIEKSHLTPDLGGYLQYSHQEWVAFRRVVEPFFANFESVQLRLSSTYQRLAAMADTHAGHSKQQLQETHSQLQDAYCGIRRGLQLDGVLDQCQDLLARFGSCDEEDIFAVLAQKPIFKETKEMVEGCHEQLVAAKRKIEDDWEDMSGRITHALQLIEYKETVTQLLDWFKTRRERDLDGGADIADNVSRAEMLCNHFETGLLIKAEDKLTKAYDVVHRGERLAVDSFDQNLSEFTRLTKMLKQDVQDFQNALRTHQHIVKSVFQFHQLYNKARRWYISCIKFLPSDLCDLYYDLRSNSGGQKYRALKLQWEEDVRRFLHKQPLLAKEGLKRLKVIPEDIGATSLRKKGRLLSHRCLILTNLLSHSEKISTANIKDILKWQSEIHLRSDESASQRSEIPPSSDQVRNTPSESSVVTANHHNQRRGKLDRKSQSRNAYKETTNRDDLNHRDPQSPERTRRNNGPRDTYPDTVDDTDNDDPLIQRLGHPASFYDRYGDTQGQITGEGYDEADDGRATREDANRTKHLERLSNGAIAYAQQPPLKTTSVGQFTRDHSQSQHVATEDGQRYGIYGDSEVEGDTAVIVPRQGPPHLPQGLSEHMLPGNLPQGDTPSGGRHFELASDPSNVASGSERLSYGLMLQDPTHFSAGYTESRRTPQLDSNGVHPLRGHTLPRTAPYNQYIGASASVNTNNNSNLNFNDQVQRDNRGHPGLSPYKYGMPSPKRSPVSLHASLMNIHQSHLDNPYSALGRQQNSNETVDNSPVMRHSSLMDLSHSPIMDQTSNASVQHNSMQMSPTKSDFESPSQNGRNSSLPNGEIHTAEQSIQNPHNSTSLRMKHGVSEPSVRMAHRDTTGASPYTRVLTNLTHLHEANAARPIQSPQTHKRSRAKTTRALRSRHSISRSEIDLREIPHGPSPPNGLSDTEHAVHRSGLSHGQISSHNASLRGVPDPDPQVDYFKMLHLSSTPPGNRFTTASSHGNQDHTLDPSTRTWMHDIPSTHSIHQAHLSARIPQSSQLSPLALLEMEVAKETMEAEEALREDEYNQEQMRRQVVIDSILNQSESSVRSHRVSASPGQVLSSHGHRGSKLEKRQNHVTSLSSSRKVVENGLHKRSHSDAPISKSQHYSPSKHNASDIPATAKINNTGLSLNGRREHPSDLSRTSLGINHSTPRELSTTERYLGLSTTLPQEDNIQVVSTSNEHELRRTLVGEPGFETSENSAQVYRKLPRGTPLNTAGESLGEPASLQQSYMPSSQAEEVDWRQENLKELGLSPREQHPVNPSLNLSKHDYQLEYGRDWRQQHLQDLGITSGRFNPTRPETKEIEWRHQHLTELGLTPSMHRSTLNKAVIPAKTSGTSSESNRDWRRQHLQELGLYPREHLVGGKPSSISSKNTTDVGSNSIIQPRDVSKLGMSPSLHQHPSPSSVKSGVSEGNVAPMTSRLQGLLESGQSFNDMDGIHHLAEESAKKSVRFSRLPDNTVLDAEEKAQEELADRLRQLELKLQEEEYSLMYKDVLDGERITLDLQLEDLDHQEEAMLSYTNQQQTGPQRVRQRDVGRTHTQNGHLYQQMGQPDQQALREDVLQPQLVIRRGLEQAAPLQGHTRHQGAVAMTQVPSGVGNRQISQHVQHAPRESSLQPQELKKRQHIEASQHPDKPVKGSPVTHPYLQNGQQNQVLVQPSQQQILEDDVQLMQLKNGQRIPHSEHSGHQVLPDAFAETGQPQGADPRRADTTKQAKTKSPIGVETQADRLNSKVGHTRDEVQGERAGMVRTPYGSSVKRTERQSDAPEHHLSHNGRHTAATETRQDRDSGMVELRNNQVSTQHDKKSYVSVLPDSAYGGESTLLSKEEQKKSEVIPYPTKTPDELKKISAVYVSSRHTSNSPSSVMPNGRFPGGSELDQLTGEPRGFEESVIHPAKSPQPLDTSKDLKRDESYSESNATIHQLGEVIPNEENRASLIERDHTAADYIACALGMDYINKQTLTVQPYSNSSKLKDERPGEHLNQSENQDHSQSEVISADATQENTSLSTQKDSESQSMDLDNAFVGIGSPDKDGMNIREMYSHRVNIPKTQVSSDGPCSPMRKWLKEKETSQVEGTVSSQSEPSLIGTVGNAQTDNHAFSKSEESPINAVQVESPISSQSTSPIRQWLREKQENEALQSGGKDFASPNGSVTDGGLGVSSDGRPNRTSDELENTEDLKPSPNDTKRRTNSVILVPVGSQRAGDSQKQKAKSQSPHEASRRSSSSIPVHKGISHSSPPTETLPSVSSAAGGNQPATEHVTSDPMRNADVKSKKSNPYSKIPVNKVYTTLKDGGYLEDQSHLKKQTSPRQVSPSGKSPSRSTVEHSKSAEPETQESRPVLERQGTFTKEPRPTLTREGTFTIEGEDEHRQSESLFFPSQDAVTPSKTTEEKHAQQSTFSPLALVLDHMVKKGTTSSTSSTSSKPEMAGGKKHHDSAEETFENSSTESSMSPTTKTTVITSNKPTTNLNHTRKYYINIDNHNDSKQGEVVGSQAMGQEVSVDTYDGLTESDRKEHDELDDTELEKMMVTKSQLAEIRNLEIENRHLAYERKEFEAHLLKNMQHQKEQANTSDEG